MGPLKGLRVIEMAGIGPAPFAAMMLADMGAEVVRVDRKAQSAASGFDALKHGGFMNRGRGVLALDLKKPEAVAALLRLIARADALIEGFRPGVMERLGLGPEHCQAINPRLVYGRVTGWGQTGPNALAAGHDLNYIAVSGALHAIGPRDRPAVPLNVIGDFGGGGMLVAVGVLAALIEAQRSGRGQVVDAAMTDGAAQLMAMQYAFKGMGAWSNAREANLLDGAAPFYTVYACADGKWLAVGALEQQFHDALVDRLGLPREEFAGRWNEAEWPRLKDRLAAVFLTRTRDAWCQLFAGVDACVSPVIDLDEAPAHPQNADRGAFVERDGAVQPAPAPRFSRTPSEIDATPPGGGTTVLEHWGFAAGEIDALRASGAI